MEQVDASGFAQARSAAGLLVACFWSKRSPPSRLQVLLLETLSPRWPTVRFVAIDVDQHPTLASEAKVVATPCLQVYLGGTQRTSVTGVVSPQTLSELLEPSAAGR